MNYWNCSSCGESMSDHGQKQISGNDTYILLYECLKCSTHGYTVTKNTRDIQGASVLKVLDKDSSDQATIDQEIQNHMS
ncbi:hypothetical protein DC846_14120 [Vibrio parahaemolyticus]|nr:hypothetical protein [Vibrio parahaemolyticus]EGR2873449.1 hypothetical protein [Vibrio parahaemolyticus]EGR2996390.1 hypothetical protein [Vibrio parahaemolyticus]EGR3239523.1 hypothetical protein [Vibrio parahaemolyticus]EGR3247718.1 hypothetical protein [Vibrio parahaemolyticus]